jgi:flagellar hook-basal body complex protein FliE
MSDITEDFLKIEKNIPGRLSRTAGHMYVKDSDLQIHVPTPGEVKNLDESKSFGGILGNYLGEVNTLQHDADSQIQKLIAGETDDLHEVTLAMDEAETSFQLMMEIRNKLVDSYREIMRMQ